MTVLSAPRLLVGGSLTGPGAVVLEGGAVVAVLDHVPPPGPHHDALPTGVLTPGLVDLQVNGAAGVDLATATPQQWDDVRRALARAGVTSFAPTFVTAPLADLAAALDALPATRERLAGEPAARLLGAHLEGPFLSAARRGAHDATLLRDPAKTDLDLLLAGGRSDEVAIVTLAPERDGALAAVERLVGAGVVVSVGHTDATAAQVSAAADAGATLVTHLFNAQRGLHHREPGVVGAGLTDPRLRVGLIVDGVHVHPAVVRLVFAAAAGRVVLVSDATAASGMPPGTYRLGDDDAVVAADGEPPRRADGTLAGSAVLLAGAVRRAVADGIDPAAALVAATRAPADAVDREDLGRIVPGAAADLVWWDDDWSVRATWLAGARCG